MLALKIPNEILADLVWFISLNTATLCTHIYTFKPALLLFGRCMVIGPSFAERSGVLTNRRLNKLSNRLCAVNTMELRAHRWHPPFRSVDLVCIFLGARLGC